MIYGKCHFCNHPVDDAFHTPCFPVRGWEPLRNAGGANQILWRQRDQTKVAHDSCVKMAADRERSGIHEAQETLV